MGIRLSRNARAAVLGAGVGLLLAGVISIAEAEFSPPRLHASAPMPATAMVTIEPSSPPAPAALAPDPAPTSWPTPNQTDTDRAAATDASGAVAEVTVTSAPSAAPDDVSGTAPVERSIPIGIDIPAIGVQAAVIPMGLAPDGTLGVPPPGQHYRDTAWYDQYPTPGERGPAVITGHLDSAHDGPSVFYRLGALTPGEQVVISRADGSTVTFTVTGIGRYPQRAFPSDSVYRDLDYAGLRLITCGGDLDPRTHHYLDNIVVYAVLTAATPPVNQD